MSGINDHVVTLAVNESPYPWHVHPDSDEFFLVVEGSLTIEIVGAPAVELAPFDSFLVPAGAVHRTTPHGRCANLLVERAGATTHFVEDPDGR